MPGGVPVPKMTALFRVRPLWLWMERGVRKIVLHSHEGFGKLAKKAKMFCADYEIDSLPALCLPHGQEGLEAGHTVGPDWPHNPGWPLRGWWVSALAFFLLTSLPTSYHFFMPLLSLNLKLKNQSASFRKLDLASTLSLFYTESLKYLSFFILWLIRGVSNQD